MTTWVQVNGGTLGTVLHATALATSTTPIVYPDYPKGSIAFHVVSTPLVLDPLGPPNAFVGSHYPDNANRDFQLSFDQVGGVLQAGGGGPYKYIVYPTPAASLAAGETDGLPAGLTLSSDGVLSGTPTVGGSYHMTVGVYDALDTFASRDYRIDIADQFALGGFAYTGAFPVRTYGDGKKAPPLYTVPTYTIVDGTLPAGLTLDPAGILYGTTTAPGFYRFTVQERYTVQEAGTSTLSRKPS